MQRFSSIFSQLACWGQFIAMLFCQMEHRPWQLYEAVFQQLLAKCHGWVAQHGGGKKFRFHNRLLSLDATGLKWT